MLVKALSLFSIIFILIGLNQESVFAITNNDIKTCENGTPAPNGIKDLCNYIADSSGHLSFLKCPNNTNNIGGNCISTFQEPMIIPDYSTTKALAAGGGGSVIITKAGQTTTNITILESFGINDLMSKQTNQPSNPTTILFGCYPYSIFKCSNSSQPIKPEDLFQCYPLSVFKC